MHFKTILPAAFTISLLLAACGGGSSSSPYDGTWQAVYPSAGITSTFTDTKVVECNTPPATLVIDSAAGTTIQSSTCTTTSIVPAIPPVLDSTGAVITPGVAEVRTTYSPQQIDYYIGVVIEAAATGDGNYDVVHAIVNGVSFAGECITTSACSAVSPAGDTLSLTR
jgi:hypothetical protein